MMSVLGSIWHWLSLLESILSDGIDDNVMCDYVRISGVRKMRIKCSILCKMRDQELYYYENCDRF
jgi:hypothetical protein